MLNNGRNLEVEFTPAGAGTPVKGEVVEFMCAPHASGANTILAIIVGHDKKVHAVGIDALTVA